MNLVPDQLGPMQAFLKQVKWSLLLFMATALSGCSNPPAPPIAISLTPSSAQAIDQGLALTVSIKATLTNDTKGKGVIWTLSGPGQINSVLLSTIYAPPTPALSSAQQATVTATSVADPTKTASIQITVNPYPIIPTQMLPSGTAGTAYSQPIMLTGGTAPFQWSLYNGPILSGSGVGGSLPSGLTLNPATGVISGTPTGAGTWYFEPAIVDVDGATAVSGFVSLEINPASAAAGNPVPFLNQPLIPSAVLPGSGAQPLAVTGSGFIAGATLNVNGISRSTTFIDKGHLTASILAADVENPGTAAITVVNPGPGGGTSNIVYLQVAAPATTATFLNAPGSPFPIRDAYGLAVADFNQDGKPDLAIASDITLVLMLGKGDGSFTTAPSSPLDLPSPPYDDFGTPFGGPIAVGDFNHSGHLGLAVAEPQNDAAVIFLGNGDGSLTLSSATFAEAEGFETSSVEAADFNADGNLDLAFTNQAGGVSPVELGYGDGAFTPAGNLYTNVQGFPAGAAIGDFNGDGKLDAAIANGGSMTYPNSSVTISLGKGDGTFDDSGSPISIGQNLAAIVAGDFNNDGKLDLAAADEAGNTVSILLGNGDGTFQPPQAITVGAGPLAIVSGDFNNDGKLDLAILNNLDGTVTLLLGNGDGTFTHASGSPYPVGQDPLNIVAADFNGDGKLDLAVSNLGGAGSISILLQQ